MTIIRLAENFIGKEDKERLEHFGGHLIATGRATRWHWAQDDDGADLLEVYHGGADERLFARIGRHSRLDEFYAEDRAGRQLGSGQLDHVMAVLEEIADRD